jgi:hypothetical protein
MLYAPGVFSSKSTFYRVKETGYLMQQANTFNLVPGQRPANLIEGHTNVWQDGDQDRLHVEVICCCYG